MTCKHAPAASWRQLLRIDENTVVTCKRCGQPLCFKGRSPLSLLCLAVLWAALFGLLLFLLHRTALPKPDLLAMAASFVLSALLWAPLSTTYMSRWEPADRRQTRNRRFHADSRQ